MRMRNRSTRTNQEILELILYVRQFAKCSDHVKITVSNGSLEEAHGNTTKYVDPTALIDVTVRVLPDEHFPFTSRYLSTMPEVTCQDWKDCFVITLAHELQHVWQFENKQKSVFAARDLSPEAIKDLSEIDAEAFGIQVLRQYQYDTLVK